MINKLKWKYENWFFRKKYAVGKYTYGLPKVFQWGTKSTLIIGKFCSIGPSVEIFLDSDHRTDWVSTYPFPAFFKELRNINGYVATKGNVSIGNDVWIGYGAKILSGVTIGDGAVIGAAAVVTKNVPPYSVVVGNPGRVVKYRFSPSEIERLLAIKWWEWHIDKILKHAEELMSDRVSCFVNNEMDEVDPTHGITNS